MLRNLKNYFDFSIRNLLSWSPAISLDEPTHPRALRFQKEFKEFLELFNWTTQKTHIRIADVGARTFVFAPVFEKHFESLGYEVDVDGFEIDPYRRFTNLRTRKSYGDYYAGKIKRGVYHPMDFLESTKKFDLICLLHPFVTLDPLLAWGLPKASFKPLELFQYSKECLNKNGLILISSPSEEEHQIALSLASSIGLHPLQQRTWTPESHAAQKKPRIGTLFSTSSNFPQL